MSKQMSLGVAAKKAGQDERKLPDINTERAFSSPAVSKPTTSLWGGLQHPQSTVTSALNNRFWCPQYYYSIPPDTDPTGTVRGSCNF
ncbi:hypothetical protein ACVWVQ_000299 [Thermostichus sp. MS-CIW-36]